MPPLPRSLRPSPSAAGARSGAGAHALGPPGLSVMDATVVLVGVEIGIGIFGFPPLVAQHATSRRCTCATGWPAAW